MHWSPATLEATLSVAMGCAPLPQTHVIEWSAEPKRRRAAAPPRSVNELTDVRGPGPPFSRELRHVPRL